jgi:uncharacterized protein YbjQ (UPF0145 family)
VGARIGTHERDHVEQIVRIEHRARSTLIAAGREHATDRLVAEAEAKGANAVIAFRFDTSELGSTWTEICAYGTAVRARKL